jgi:cytochrome P450
MLEMVEARRTSHEVEERHDLFSGLLDASQEEMNNGQALSDEELLGKCSVVAPFSSLEGIFTRYSRKHVHL